MAKQHKFLVDVSLLRLGRWLRTAGYDTVIAEQRLDGTQSKDSIAAYYLLQQARSEDRFFLSTNPTILKLRRAKDTVLLVNPVDMEKCVAELSLRLNINWYLKPFSRCTTCNTMLESDNAAPANHNVYCPACNLVFWNDANTTRLRKQLEHWQHKHSP